MRLPSVFFPRSMRIYNSPNINLSLCASLPKSYTINTTYKYVARGTYSSQFARKPCKAKPGRAKPRQAKQNKAKSNTAKPSLNKPGQAKQRKRNYLYLERISLSRAPATITHERSRRDDTRFFSRRDVTPGVLAKESKRCGAFPLLRVLSAPNSLNSPRVTSRKTKSVWCI